MMEEAPVSAAAAIFVILLLLHLFSEYYSRIAPTAQLRPQERGLVKEISELHRAADALSTPSTFAKAAKLKRQAAVKEKELALLRQNLALQRGWWLSLYSTAPNALKIPVSLRCIEVGSKVPIGVFLWITAHCKVHGWYYAELLMSRNKQLSGGEVAVGIVPWLILTSRVSKFFSTTIVGKPPSRKSATKSS